MAENNLSELKKFEDAAAACNRCGFCTSYCPTYNATGNEAHSPRGRTQMFRALIEGKVTDVAQAAESVDTCLLCGECTSVCFSEVPTAQLMVQARSYINRMKGTPLFLSLFLSWILPYPKRLYWILKISFVGKRLGISWLLAKAGLLARFAPALEAGDQILPKPPLKFLLDHAGARAYRERDVFEASQANARRAGKSPHADAAAWQRPTIALMPVCGNQYVRPEIGLATIELLKKLKVDFVIPDAVCCGLPAASYGVIERVRALAQANIVRFEQSRFESVVVDDSSCATHLKELPKYFADDQPWLKRAHDISQKIRDLSTFFLQHGLKEHLKLAPWQGGKVAFHDPCKAQYGQRLTHPPRELLAAIPNLKLAPIAEADQCCGGAGTYSVAHPEMSQAVLEAKIKNIAASGCDIVVTSSASCLVQLAFGLRKVKSKIQVLHLTEFLVRAMNQRR